MTLLDLWVHTPLAKSLGWTLVHSLWEGALIALALAAALCVARSSRARYGATCAALLLMLAAFAVTLLRLMPQPMDLAKAPRVPVQLTNAPAGLPAIPVEEPSVPSGLAAVLPWIAPFWVAGVLFFHLRALGGWIAARRLRRSGVCRAPREWQRRLDGLTARLRVSKPAALLESCLADAPVVMGYLRPVILMPVGLLAGLPIAQVEAILIHELAHIRRQDYLVNLLQTFVEGLLFYHPAVWWISGVIRAERENCCDDLAVAATGDARVYAAALAALEQNRWAGRDLALAATGGSLVKRIRRLLQQPERPRAAWTPVISVGILVVSAGIAFAGWQTQTAQKLLIPPVSAVSPARTVPIVIALPGARLRKPARVLLAQTAPVPQSTQSVEQQLKDVVQREATALQEIPTPYRKWLNEDVAYIITDAERNAFKALTTDAERERFITQFWLRRDPTPGTPENEFKQEHYRRIAYANEHFATSSHPSLPGWKTDRGRIYITYGPPDEIEDHSSGGFYARPPAEGGGTTSTYPFQQWRYRYIEGIGNNIVIEFIDPTMSGEFRMTTDPSEKDALLYTAGSSLPHPCPGASRSGFGCVDFPNSDVFVSAGDAPKITVSITSDKKMHLNVVLPPDNALAEIRMSGQTVDINNRIVNRFGHLVANLQPDEDLGSPLPSGSYTLTVVVANLTSGATYTRTVNFYVN